LVNDYPLEIGLYLVASGASCDAIDAMHKAGITVCYKTVENYRKKVVAAHLENIRKYFAEKEPIYTLLRP
ncbi:671_t:CDS:2, partial [Racocetra persica]